MPGSSGGSPAEGASEKARKPAKPHSRRRWPSDRQAEQQRGAAEDQREGDPDDEIGENRVGGPLQTFIGLHGSAAGRRLHNGRAMIMAVRVSNDLGGENEGGDAEVLDRRHEDACRDSRQNRGEIRLRRNIVFPCGSVAGKADGVAGVVRRVVQRIAAGEAGAGQQRQPEGQDDTARRMAIVKGSGNSR